MSLPVVPSSHFEVIEANLNVKLIIPVLEDVGLLSPSEKDKLASKSQKQAVKLILKNARQHSDGSKLFCYALEQTKADEKHRMILQLLEEFNSQEKGTIYSCVNTLDTKCAIQ